MIELKQINIFGEVNKTDENGNILKELSKEMIINIKPLSVNECWRGRRFKTDKYKMYERNLFTLLPKIQLPEPPYKVIIEFGFSSAASDLDNPVKPFIDILQKKYSFNDKLIHEFNLTKKKVKKGDEYIKWDIINIK